MKRSEGKEKGQGSFERRKVEEVAEVALERSRE